MARNNRAILCFIQSIWILHNLSNSIVETADQIQWIRKLNQLRSYKDAQFFRFEIPPETSVALFRLNASQSDSQINTTMTSWWNETQLIRSPPKQEESKPRWPSSLFSPWLNTTKMTVYVDKAIRFYQSILSSACKKPLPVKFYVRWGSLPLISIKNGSNPSNFIFKNASNQFVTDLKTNGQFFWLRIDNPLPGDWYGMAFIEQINEKISPKDLEKECHYQFQSSLTLESFYSSSSSSLSQSPLSIISSIYSSQTRTITNLVPSPTYSHRDSMIIDHQDSKDPELFYKFSLNLQEYGVKIIIADCHFFGSTNLRHHSSKPMMMMASTGPSDSSTIYRSQPNAAEQFSLNNGTVSNGTTFAPNVICPIRINYRALAIPNVTNYEFQFDCQTNSTNVEISYDGSKCIIDLPSYAPDRWNYLQITPLVINSNQNHHHHYIHQHYQTSKQEQNNENIFVRKQLNNLSNEPRTNLLYGSINFTIQLLSGQDALLYNYFNDQNCQSNQSQQQQQQPSTSAATFTPSEINYNYLIKSDSDRSESSSSLPSSSSISTISSKTANNNLTHINDRPQTENHHHPITKRLAEPQQSSQQTLPSQQNPNRDRKKSNKDKKERRLKKQKNKNRQKNRQDKFLTSSSSLLSSSLLEKQCQFDPMKVIATLDDDDLANMTTFSVYNLTRYQGSENFEFQNTYYDLMDPNRIAMNRTEHHSIDYISQFSSSSFSSFAIPSPSPPTSSSIFIDIQNDHFALFNFSVLPQFDIGGNLVINFAISPWTNNIWQNVSATLCLTHNRLPPIYSTPSPSSTTSLTVNGSRLDEHCYGYLISNTSSANFSLIGSALQSLVVPYPQPGTWFIAIAIRCYNNEADVDDYMVMSADYTSSCDYFNKTSILLDVHSSACLKSGCLNNGKCQQYLNGGLLFSACSCRAGWKGWICNDGSEKLSDRKLLINFLLLTVSNTAFIPAIVLAACRKYFTESAVYFITMISSSLYHACDSDFSQSYCVFSINLLQFADFYTAILSFFVTLLTLAYLPPSCKSFLHFLGAILIALITQNDRTSLWTFLIPAGIGTILLFLCWCSRCCRKSCYPPSHCWIFSVCPALIFTIIGLIIYAFFETQDNYALMHSIWHGIVALALLLAIPSMPPQRSSENEDDDDENVNFISSTGSSTAGSGKGIQNAKMVHVQEWRPPHTSFKFLHDDIDML